MRIRKHNVGRNPLLYPELKGMEEIRNYDLRKMLEDGLYALRFHSIVSAIPVHSVDKGMIGVHHFWLSTRGIIMLSCNCGGVCFHTHVTFRGHTMKSEKPVYYFCGWDMLRKGRQGEIVFFDRKTHISRKRAVGIFVRELVRARESSLRFGLNAFDLQSSILNDRAKDGIAIQPSGYVYIRKDDKARNYWYVRWLSVSQFLELRKAVLCKENFEKVAK